MPAAAAAAAASLEALPHIVHEPACARLIVRPQCLPLVRSLLLPQQRPLPEVGGRAQLRQHLQGKGRGGGGGEASASGISSIGGGRGIS